MSSRYEIDILAEACEAAHEVLAAWNKARESSDPIDIFARTHATEYDPQFDARKFIAYPDNVIDFHTWRKTK